MLQTHHPPVLLFNSILWCFVAHKIIFKTFVKFLCMFTGCQVNGLLHFIELFTPDFQQQFPVWATPHVTAGWQNNLGNQRLLLLVWYALDINTVSDWLLHQFLKLWLAIFAHVYIWDQSETVGYNYRIISDYCNVVNWQPHYLNIQSHSSGWWQLLLIWKLNISKPKTHSKLNHH